MIHVACSADDNFLPHCGTMLQSLFANNRGVSFCVHFLCRSLTEENRKRLQSVTDAHGAQLQLHVIDAEAVRDFPTEKFHASCWYRVLLPELLPDIDRVLYIDADIVVLDGIQSLWRTELGEALFGAVANPLYPFIPNRVLSELGIEDPREYLNSGVLLMNLDAMRRQQLVERLRDYARLHPENLWPEQDALSVVCRGQWRPLEARWNAQSTVFELDDALLPFADAEITEARNRPALVHFIGPHKPWHYLCRHPMRDCYQEYRRQTPWGAGELEGRNLVNFLMRPLSLNTQLRLKSFKRNLVSLYRG